MPETDEGSGGVGLPPDWTWSWAESSPASVRWTTAPPRRQAAGPSPAPAPPQRSWLRPLLAVLLTVSLVLGITGGVLVVGTNAYASDYEDRILPGATIAGVDVSGMTADEAVAAVALELTEQLDHEVTVRSTGRSWTVTPADLGATSDLEEVAAQLVADSAAVGWSELARIRWFGASALAARDVAVTTPDDAAVRAFVDDIAEELNQPAVDATLQVTGGRVVITPAQTGQVVDTAHSSGALAAVLREGGSGFDLVVHPVQPDVTAAAFDQVLLLDQSEHRLELWQNGVLTHEWPVAVGTSGYPTPTGQFHVSAKRYRPTWVNPSPNGWGSHLPRKIGPGRHNPLGLRALNWSAPGAIRFHGTAAVGSIGRDASHGCVRLTNDDVIELYDLVDEGAVIVSLR